MKKKTHIICLGLITLNLQFLTPNSFSQNVGISESGGTPDASSGLDIDFTDKGVLVPRVALTATNSATPITSPTTSLLVYNTATAGTSPNNVTPGFYYWNGSKWIAIDGDGGEDWTLTGNSGTVDGTHFIGTTDNAPVNFRVNNLESGKIDNSIGSTFLGYRAGEANTSGGTNNTAIGFFALNANTTGDQNTALAQSALAANTTGSFNTATGFAALGSNTTGQTNTANGLSALTANTIGSANVAVGTNAMVSNTTAGLNTAVGAGALFTQSYSNSGVAWNSENVAIGHEAMYFNQPTVSTNGYRNVAVGNSAMRLNTTGAFNTAIGYQALTANTSGIDNTGVGYQSLSSTTTGDFNTAVGMIAARDLTTGSSNVAVGMQALLLNSTANDNTAVGVNALLNTTAAGNTAVGRNAMNVNTTGTNNTTIGYNSDVSSSGLTNATAIGYNAQVAASNTMILGGTGSDAVEVGVGLTTPKGMLNLYANGAGSTDMHEITTPATKNLADNTSWQTILDIPINNYGSAVVEAHVRLGGINGEAEYGSYYRKWVVKKIFAGGLVVTQIDAGDATEGGVLTAIQQVTSGSGSTSNFQVQVRRTSGSDAIFRSYACFRIMGSVLGTITY